MSGRCLNFENPIRDSISRIRFAPESNNLLISSWDSTLRVYDVDSSVTKVEFPAETPILDCCFQIESVAFSAASDGFIKSYDLHSGTHDNIGKHSDTVTCLEYSDETCQLISTGWDKKMMSWDTRSASHIGCFETLDAKIETISIYGLYLMAASGKSVNIYDLRDLSKSVHTKELCMETRVKCVRPIFSPQGFVAGSFDGRVTLQYHYPSNAVDTGYTFRCHPKSKDKKHLLASVNDIVFNPCLNGAFVTGDNEGYVILWNAQSKRKILELPRYPNSVASLSYNHKGQLLAVASSHTYQELNEIEDTTHIFVVEMDAEIPKEENII
ncbi:mitotic checkpoint protein BUB3.3 [Impatiens glandulifera]|uniref:mitotic checkpoint protein BUB3.3 n=1 Tax=Impatiens glandulifera TaxID=253017 RepID=UPI001FB11978|nr:mitotic checkpoint protein BUB3.3 [Impatiens glandulifera]